MNIFARFVITTLLLLSPLQGSGQNIFRFDHIGSEEGLSQNTAFSILFDSKGFMWIGTMNGLNRYDGYEFKIFRSSPGNPEGFTNNRVVKLWEDIRGFIWLETYDGYYHFFNPETETFHSLPQYEGSNLHNGEMKVFLQYSDDLIFLGSAESGLYLLKYDEKEKTYNINRFIAEDNFSISDNSIRFIQKDSFGNVWIGTKKGLNILPAAGVNKPGGAILKRYLNMAFTSVCETDKEIWLGTEHDGVIVHKKDSQITRVISVNTNMELISDEITHLYHSRTGIILAAFKNKGLMITSNEGGSWKDVKFHSQNLDKIYEDRNHQLWLTAVEFGVTRLDLRTFDNRFYLLTPQEITPLTDLERLQFFEDSRGNLWLGLHGNGLGLYNRDTDNFRFYRNDPTDPNTISSNFVHCITEDRSGQLWVGTGQVLGGVEKVIPENKAFEHYLLEKEPSDVLDNVSRAILEDQNRFLWVATKAGRIHLFDSTLSQKRVFQLLPGIGHESLRNITYTLFNDSRGYLWIGSKGYGLSVTTRPLNIFLPDYSNISFRRFTYLPGDESSLGNNNIYSVCEDKSGQIWIGTYGNGLSLIKNPSDENPAFLRINQANSNLSSNLIRNLMVDSSGNLWVATTFGLNLLEKNNLDAGNFSFKVFLKDPSVDKSLIYNDVIHIFEDSQNRLWFGTFGGGIDLLEKLEGDTASFRHYVCDAGAGYGIVYGILEDRTGKIWYSSENGLICLDPEAGTTGIFNHINGLGFNSFSENTCCFRSNDELIFGGYLGFEIVDPAKLSQPRTLTKIELTKFLLFNKEVTTGQDDSPLKKSISFTDELILRYFQSSFSIDFSALDFIDPEKVQYTYKLENFEENWNYIGNQNRANYTNLSPGSYTFRVKTILNESEYSSPERILKITITPPWWKTSLAYLMYALMIAATTLLIYNAVTRISRYKNALAIEKKVNELKLQFFTNISHEIRTPLTLIIGPLEDLMAEKTISPGRKLQLSIMLKNARRMLHLTNQLLDFRKIQNNKMMLKIMGIDIVAFTKEIFDSFVPLARHKGIIYNFNSDFESFKIFADPSKLDIMIYNLISNAIKFTNTGKNVSVKICESAQNRTIDISITDEGPGIPQKSLSDIFTRYTILSNQDLAGTGIGLSLSYELARLHKGDILINSTVGLGSTFTLRLLTGKEHLYEVPGIETGELDSKIASYRHTIDYSEIPEEERRIHGSDPADKNLLLLVEDNTEILNYICQSLKPYYMTIGAKNGEEGLHLAKTMNPDIIITDIRMPGMDGIEMTRKLKEDFITSHIPVIILTSKADMKDQIEGIETGAEAYIVKPFNMDYLKTMVANLLRQRAKILGHFMNNKADTVTINSRDGEFLRKLIKCIEENCSKELCVADLADECNMSRTVLYNKIKGLTGYSPIEFLRNLKMNIAAKLLEKGYNVSEAAYKTGFSDVKYFSKIFKAQFGYTPSRHKIAQD